MDPGISVTIGAGGSDAAAWAQAILSAAAIIVAAGMTRWQMSESERAKIRAAYSTIEHACAITDAAAHHVRASTIRNPDGSKHKGHPDRLVEAAQLAMQSLAIHDLPDGRFFIPIAAIRINCEFALRCVRVANKQIAEEGAADVDTAELLEDIAAFANHFRELAKKVADSHKFSFEKTLLFWRGTSI